MFAAFEKQDKRELVKDTDGFDKCSAEETLAQKFFNALFYKCDVDYRGDHLQRLILEFTIRVASGKDVYPDIVRAAAMATLEVYTGEYNDDIRGTIKFPQSLYDATIDLANHSDVKISSEALGLLGHISHRIEKISKAPVTKTAVQRIDFDKADIKQVIRHYGPYRFPTFILMILRK